MIEGSVSGLYINDQGCPFIQAELDGLVGDKHRGFVKNSDVRDRPLSKKIPVQNWRQWSAVSKEELSVVAKNLGIAALDPSLLDANLEFSGIDKFTQLPTGTKIWFPQDTILKVESDNEPCIYPGGKIAKTHPSVIPSNFVKAAWGLRGIVGIVYRAGIINLGDKVTIEIYTPKTYSLP